VLSWAVPTQPGAMHVNARTADYVSTLLTQRGLTLDVDATKRLRNVSVEPWFQQNLVLYRKPRPAIKLKPND